MIGSLGFVALGILIPLATEGREVAEAVGKAGDNILPFNPALMAIIRIHRLISTLIWTIWTGLIFVKK